MHPNDKPFHILDDFFDDFFLDDKLKFISICLVTKYSEDTVSLDFISYGDKEIFPSCLGSDKNITDFIPIVSQNFASLWDEVLPENLTDILRENKFYNGLTLFRPIDDKHYILISMAMETPINDPKTYYLNIMHKFNLIIGKPVDFYIDLYKNAVLAKTTSVHLKMVTE